MQDCRKAVWSIPYVSVAFFPSVRQNFIAYRSSKVSDCIFEIHQSWQWGFSKMYTNNIYFQESTTILNDCTKKVWKLIEGTTYVLSYVEIWFICYWIVLVSWTCLKCSIVCFKTWTFFYLSIIICMHTDIYQVFLPNACNLTQSYVFRYSYPYLATHPLGQDMTQGQFLNWV